MPGAGGGDVQLDEALLEQQREAYAVQGVDESEPAGPTIKKRKNVYVNGEEVRCGMFFTPNPPFSLSIDWSVTRGGLLTMYCTKWQENGRAVSKKAKASAEPRERKNTAVYVTSLPTDITLDEVNRVFSRCGVIAEEIDRGKPRIKLYTDEEGKFKGDALIVYFRAESVDLAIQMLDDTDFRLGQPAAAGKMKVAAADFSYKTQKEAPAKSNMKDKKKIMKKTQKLNK